MSITINVISCRWCGKKVLPNLETGEYPKKCPGRSCRRQTWNKSDLEIREARERSTKALLNNHKDGKINVSERQLKSSSRDFVQKMDLPKKKSFVCKVCERFYYHEEALKRHQERRNHYVD